MKLLLTSSGLRNKSIVGALLELQGKPFSKTNLAFIPTAANVEEGDKFWLIDDLANCKKLGFASIDIVDISAIPENLWKPRLVAADVLLFGGGNTFHLIYWIRKSGLEEFLPRLLKKRVYAGISAGSMVASKRILLSESKKLYYEDLKGYQDEKGLGFVSFQIRPHLNNNFFPNVKEGILKEQAKKVPEQIYALDDEMAIKVDDKNIEVVGAGKYLLLNAS
ncbi:Type 1 glutamine amidotransferase-like domain-containing protein [Candidatus Curtissbacteria bacterium]|nr:Type 1 glutamine amidotransferase-like domain-containing protein [Candidatus Curtissbacteria bacterium]